MSRRPSDPIAAVRVDRLSPVPLYHQVATQLAQAIAAGQLTPGSRVANELDLTVQLGLSRPTIRRALQELVDQGLLVRRRGIGTRVVSPQVRRSLELSSLHDDLSRDGQRPATRVLSIERIAAEAEVARALGLRRGQPVLQLIRLRSARDQPIAKLTNHLPIDLLDVDADDLVERGLYELIREAGIQLHSATQSIGARIATAAEARLLAEPRPTALLTMQRIAYDDHGQPVEHGDHVYAASRYSFQLSLLAH